MLKLSVVIPSYKDPLLTKTIGSILENSELGDQIEIIAVLDGYWPSFELVQDRRVRYIHLGQNVGMRRAINAGVRISRGEYLMRADEHQVFSKGFDKIILETIQDNWIVTPRRHFLDVDKWEVMENPPVNYMTLEIRGQGEQRKFTGIERPDDPNQLIQESQAMQGSCWFMKRSWWDSVIGELQNEGYGPHYQDSHEMVFKTWKAGGKLMINKNCWHAHKHRSFPRTHNNGTQENPSNNEQCWGYSLQVWEPYYNELKAEGKL
jgi:GT2 family glycosyltransferase